jgi:ribonuclease G
MKSELIVDVQPGEVSIALLEDSRLMSLQKEARNIAYAVGDIYLAKVKKLMPGLNAAFVNVGYEKDAFLHYLDLGSHFTSYEKFMTELLGDDRKHVPQLSKMKLLPDIDKHGAIADLLQPGRELMVQIVKEPISSKGPRLSTEITFTGRYLVLIPFSDKISISQKIKTTEEKVRLRQLIDSIKPKNFGVIVRTSAEGKRVAELNHELKTLVKYWEDACAKAQKSEVPSLIFEEESRIVGMLRDVFSPSFEAIHVNDPETYTQIYNYVSLIAPERKDIVKLYSKPEPIFDTFAVTRQIKSSFGKTVSFKSGAYIIIEHTEALHVIDVNSGNRTKATNDQETNALEVNLRAADEIARQLRLRDMGGIIVIDYIDMNKNEHRQQLYEHMREVMANDRARHNILPLSKFGLMQITRQRVRPALDITTTETCPSCFGKGEVQPSLLFTDTLFEKIEYVVNELGKTGFNVYVHPFVEAYLKKGWLLSLASRWRRQLGGKFKIYADQSLAYLQYRVIDSDGNILDLKQEKDTNSSSAEKNNSKLAARGEADTKELAEQKPKANKNKAAKASKTPKNDAPTEAPVITPADADNALPEPDTDTSIPTPEQAQKPRKPRKQRPQKQAKAKPQAQPQPASTTETTTLDAPDYTKALPEHFDDDRAPSQSQNSDIPGSKQPANE